MKVEPSRVQMGDSFRATFTFEDAHTVVGSPDLTPLQQDFTIAGTERSMSYSVINGQAQGISQWTVLLIPKKSGLLSIPHLRIGQQQSPTAQIEVTEEATVPEENNSVADVANQAFLDTVTSEEKPFVNQEVIYTVKFYHREHLLDVNYQPPHAEDALLFPLGDARRYQTMKQGYTYQVEEQRYAIFPQKSGSLRVTPPRLTGLVFGEFPHRLHLKGKPIVLQVKARAEQFPGKYWLPAQEVTIREHFSASEKQLKQGATLVRAVTLQARGVPAQLLPPLTFKDSSQYNLYPEKPQEKNRVVQDGVIGSTTYKVTYLFNHSGSVTIPALKIMWFNTKTGQNEIATLPKHVFEVTPETSIKFPPSSMQPKISPTQEHTKASLNSSVSYTWAVWLALGFVLAGISIFMIGRFRGTSSSTTRSATKKIHKACQYNDPAMAKEALQQWAGAKWPEKTFLNLHAVEKQVKNTALQQQLQYLTQVLYTAHPHSWQGSMLWGAFSQYNEKPPTVKSKVNNLPPLNPT